MCTRKLASSEKVSNHWKFTRSKQRLRWARGLLSLKNHWLCSTKCFTFWCWKRKWFKTLRTKWTTIRARMAVFHCFLICCPKRWSKKWSLTSHISSTSSLSLTRSDKRWVLTVLLLWSLIMRMIVTRLSWRQTNLWSRLSTESHRDRKSFSLCSTSVSNQNWKKSTRRRSTFWIGAWTGRRSRILRLCFWTLWLRLRNESRITHMIHSIDLKMMISKLILPKRCSGLWDKLLVIGAWKSVFRSRRLRTAKTSTSNFIWIMLKRLSTWW